MNIPLLEAAGVSLAAGAAPGKKNAPTEGGLFAALLASLTASAAEAEAAPVTEALTPEAEAADLAEALKAETGTEGAGTVAVEFEVPVAETEASDEEVSIVAAAALETGQTIPSAPPVTMPTSVAVVESVESIDEPTVPRALPSAAPQIEPKSMEGESSEALTSVAAKAVTPVPSADAEDAPATPVPKPLAGAVSQSEPALRQSAEPFVAPAAKPAVAAAGTAPPNASVANVQSVAEAEPVPVLPDAKPLTATAAPAPLVAKAAVEQTVRVAETAPVPVLRVAATALRTDGAIEATPEEPEQPAKAFGLLADAPEPEIAVDAEVPEPALPKVTPERPVLAAAEEAAVRERPQPELMTARAERPVNQSPSPEPQGITAVRGVEAAATAETPQPAAPPSRDAMLPERVALHDIGRAAAGGVRQLAAQGGGSLVIRIAPESLGDLRIEVRREDGQVTVKVTASNQAVREALESGAHGLRDILAREGVELKQMQVSAPPSGGQPQTHQQAQQHTQDSAGQRGTGGGYRPQPDAPSRQESYPSSQGERTPRPSHQGALNVWA